MPGLSRRRRGKKACPWPVIAAQPEAGSAPEMAMTPQPLTRRAAMPPNGFGSYVALVPSEDIGMVILANRNSSNPVRAGVTRKLITEVPALDQR